MKKKKNVRLRKAYVRRIHSKSHQIFPIDNQENCTSSAELKTVLKPKN